MNRSTNILCLLLSILCCGTTVVADTSASRDAKLQTLRTIVSPVQWHWRYKIADVPNAQDPALDDTSWELKNAEAFKWGNQPVAWFRTVLTVPEDVGGVSVKGSRITFRCGIDDDGIIYVNGREAQRFHRDQGKAVISDSAAPGEKIQISVKGINVMGPGALLFSSVEYSQLNRLRAGAERLLSGYDYALSVGRAAGLAEKDPYFARANAAFDRVNLDGLTRGNSDAFIASVDAVGMDLTRIAGEITSPLSVSLVGHAHIDFAFLWSWPETLGVIKNTFSTATNLMDEFPYVLSQSQAGLYAQTKRDYPDIYSRIQERVKRGQWDVSTASTWSEGDTNLSSGEAIVRSILLAKRFIKQEFGIEPTVGWAPDNFGHAWTLPQILSKSGIKYYYFMRGPGKPLFWWQSPDGSKVLAYQYGSYNQGIGEQDLASSAVRFCARTGVTDYMRLYGVGDHGGGPTKAHLREVTQLQSRTDYPKLEFSSAQAYFDKVAQSGTAFPTISTELNPVFPGCYTSHGDAKRYNRECENALASSETIASIASGLGVAYPAEEFKSSWRKTCFNQFHDIICGTTIHSSYEYAKQLRDEVISQTSIASDAAMKALASKIDTRGEGIPIVVYNPLSWVRTDSVAVTSPFAGQATAVKITDSEGRVCAGRSLGNRLTFTARDVPATGYKVFWVSRVSKSVGSNVSANGSTIENQFFRVKVEPKTGLITSIYDKKNRRDVLAPGQCTDLLQIVSEQSDKMSAWKIGPFVAKKTLLDSSEVVRIDTGPAKVTLQYDHRYGQSIFTQELTLYDAVPRIDIKLAAEWKEPWVQGKTTPMLKVAFPSNLKNPKATFEIPFGSIERAKDGSEVVGQKWADLSDSGYGVSILNDCKYGFDVIGSTLRMSLIRSPQRPDPRADRGMHEMTFSIYPHKGDWRSAGTVRRGYELNEPLVAAVTTAHEGALPAAKSFLSVSAPNLVVTALKQSEEGDGLIIRLYETNGQACEAVIRTGVPGASYVETDLMENPISEPATLSNGQFSTKVGKYEIKTYKIF